MSRRTAALLLGSLLLLTGAVTAAIFVRSVPRVTLSDDPSEADHVTLYQNGLAAVRLSRTFATDGGDSALVVSLPANAIVDSLAVEGPGVVTREVRSTLASSAGVHPGDNVTVHVEGRAWQGTVLAVEQPYIVLASDGSSVHVDASKATAIEVAARPAAPHAPGSAEATVLVRAPPGAHAVNVSYLLQGAGWTPSYRLDADTGGLVLFATLTGLDDWRNVTLDLVAGTPNVVYSPSRWGSPTFAESTHSLRATLSYDASGFSPSVPMGDLHRYRYDGRLDLARGETVRLPLLQGTLDELRPYHQAIDGTGWGGSGGDAQDVRVQEKLGFRNPFSDPLPAGIVRAYRGGAWVGEDTMPATAPGEQGNVTLATSQTIKAKAELLSHVATHSSDTWTYRLTVTAHGAQGGEVRAGFSIPTWRTTIHKTTPEGAEVRGDQAIWWTTLSAGGEATFGVTYETMKY